jgi:hypothetical protein
MCTSHVRTDRALACVCTTSLHCYQQVIHVLHYTEVLITHAVYAAALV